MDCKQELPGRPPLASCGTNDDGNIHFSFDDGTYAYVNLGKGEENDNWHWIKFSVFKSRSS